MVVVSFSSDNMILIEHSTVRLLFKNDGNYPVQDFKFVAPLKKIKVFLGSRLETFDFSSYITKDVKTLRSNMCSKYSVYDSGSGSCKCVPGVTFLDAQTHLCNM